MASTLNLQTMSTSGEIVDLATDQMAKPTIILPFGDSITAGVTQEVVVNPSDLSTEPGYRGPLWYEFVLNDMFVNFVGPNNNGPPSLPDTSNAGFPGDTTAQLLELLSGILAQGVPQDILLLAGINDVLQGIPQATTIANLTSIIQTIESASPTTHVYLSQLTPLVAYSVTSLNIAISSLVSQLSAEGENVSLVSQADVTAADIGDDGVHPTVAGYALIAQNWYSAILADQPNVGGTLAGTVSAISPNTVDIVGGPGSEYLIGNSQNNTITAGLGDDLLSGAGGIDTLVGGAGADQYLITDVSGQVTIVNFNPAKGDYLDWSGISGLIDSTALASVTMHIDGQTVVDLSPFGVNQQVILSDYTGSLANSQFLNTPVLTPITVGSGLNTLALTVAERGAPAGAQFIISVDGMQIGGVQTTAADMAFGESQTFDVEGGFEPGPNAVLITYLNAHNSVLSVQTATINGTTVPNSVIALSNNGSAGFSFTGPAANAPVTIGEGADSLALQVSQRGQLSGAEFTVNVDGTQVGGVQTTAADYTAGLTQTFEVLGSFPAGSNTISVNYLNANNSVLIVNNASIDGITVPASTLILSNIGSGGFTFLAPNPAVPGTIVIGSGADTLALTLSQRGQPSGALFTITVDGTQVGGTQSVTADSLTSQTQVLDVLGNFGSGPHTASIDYLNASDSTLSVISAAINGSSIFGGNVVLSDTGTTSFTFSSPPSLSIVVTPAPTIPTLTVPGAGPAAIVNTTTPTVAGTTSSDTIVTLFANGIAEGTGGTTYPTGTSTTGTYTATLSPGLALGFEQVVAVATNTAGTATSAPLDLDVLPAPINGVTTLAASSLDAATLLGLGYRFQFVSGTEALQLTNGTLSVGPDTTQALVQRLYKGLLGRTGDTFGLAGFNADLVNGGSPASVATSILTSSEYGVLPGAPTSQTDTQFVTGLYQGFLSRGPDQPGLAGWVNDLAQGSSRGQIAADVAQSAEAKTNLASATAHVWVPDPDGALVTELYETGLGRAPDLAGLQGWQQQLSAGLTPLQLSQGIATSAEFNADHAGSSNAALVTSLYQAGLGRTPGSSELQGWVGQLQAGAGSTNVLLGIATSAEASFHLLPTI